MQQYLSNMLERTNNVISNVINKVFQIRPNLLTQIRLMYENIERQLKSESQRELELILEMEESFVYADHPIYKETLKRIKRSHKSSNSNESSHVTTIQQSARLPYTPAHAATSSMTTSVKRTSGALSEDNDEDDIDDHYSPPVKISRPNNPSTSRLTSCKYH